MCGVNCVKPGLRFRRILLICCLVFSVFWFPPAAVRADIGWGESPLVYVDTQGLEPGMLTGRILAGGTPIQGAAITLEPANLATTSEADGTFTLAGVPAGTGYQLQVIAAGYEVAIVSGLGVAGGSQDLGDIVLSPLTGTFVLRSTVPEINPAVSEVEQGGVAYRYYIVRNQADGTPVGGVSVVVREAGCGTPVDQTEAGALPGVAGKVAGVSDVGSGIVRLRIPADEVGSGLPGASEQFEAVVSGTVGPTFWVSVRARSYEHDWAQESRGGLHGKVNLIAGGRLGGEVGHRVEVVRAYDGSSETEELAREMAGRVEFGVEAGLPIGGKANVAGVTAGAYASAGAGGYAELYRAFGYEFDPYSTDASSAALRLYCMYAELGDFVPVMGPLLMLVRTTIEPILVDDVYRWSEAGFQFGPYVEVEGILGAKVGKEFAVGAYGNLDVEGAIGASTRYHVLEGRRESQIGVGATIEAAAGIGIGFRPYKGTGRPAGVETVMNNLGVLLNPSASASLTVEQSAMDVVYDGASRPSEVRLVTLIGGGLNVPGFNLIDYLGTGAQQGEELAIAELDLIQPIASSADWERTKGISGKLRLLYDRLGPVGMNAIFGDEMARALFPQDPYQSDMRYDLRARLVDPDRIEAGASGHIIAGGGFEVKFDWEKGRSFLLESGKMRRGLVYPLERTAGAEGIPTNDLTIGDLQVIWFDQATSVLQDAWNRFTQDVHEVGETVIVAVLPNGQAVVTAAEGAWAAGTTIVVDSWEALTGGGTESGLAGQAWIMDEGSITLGYGVGGMYRFTADTDPTEPVTLELSYQEEQVVGFDEADLLIYRLDDENDLWELIGGTVDTEANTVAASVSSVGVFALGPPLPTGTLTFQLSATVLPGDGVSTVTAEATNLMLNNGTAAGDGWAYTVSATEMEILTTDADPDVEGVQALSSGGAVSLEFQAPTSGGVGTFAVVSVYGDAGGEGMIAFADTTAPPAVGTVTVEPGQTRLYVWWDASGMPSDVESYRVYYAENHVPPPFDGVAGVEGQPSPVTVSASAAILRGLNLGSEYHVAVSAVDASGNEGPLSDVAVATTLESPPAPPTDVDSEPDGPEQFVVAWTLSEDDGFNDRDVDHYEVYRRVEGSGERVKAADVPAGQAVYTDTIPGFPGGLAVFYDLITVDSTGRSSPPSGLFAPADFNRDGFVDHDDLDLFEPCATGPAVNYNPWELPPGCSLEPSLLGFIAADFDLDNDVDQSDFGVFQACISGDELADPTCAD